MGYWINFDTTGTRVHLDRLPLRQQAGKETGKRSVGVGCHGTGLWMEDGGEKIQRMQGLQARLVAAAE